MLFLTAVLPLVAAQDASAALPASTAARLAALVAPHARADAPGGVLAVARDGEIVWARAFGHTREGGDPIEADTVFYLASTSKQLTAACVAHAARAGALDLDQGIGERFPELPPWTRAITPRQLIHHRGGVPDFYEVAMLADLPRERYATNDDVVALLARLERPCFAPGERCAYSNSGYVLLAELLERATGSSLADYAAEHLFGPLGMASSRFGGPPEGRPRAHGHGRASDGHAPEREPPALVGQGGAWSTAGDLARWDAALAAGSFGDAALCATLATPPELSDAQHRHPTFDGYAFGVLVGRQGDVATVRHGGAAFGFRAELLRFPEQGLAVICLGNAADLPADDLADAVAAVLLEDELAGVPEPATSSGVELAPEDVARLAGFWLGPDAGLWGLLPRGAGLVARTLDGGCALVAESATRLRSAGAPVPVAFELEPQAGLLTVRVAGGPPDVLRRHARRTLGAEELAEYAGTWTCDALGGELTLVVREGALALEPRHPLFPPPTLLPLEGEVFVGDPGVVLRFRRGADGELAGCSASSPRAWHLELRRAQ